MSKRSSLLLLPFLFLATLASGAGREVTTPDLVPAAYPMTGALTAFNGTRFLTVWKVTVAGSGSYLWATLSEPGGARAGAPILLEANGSFAPQQLVAIGSDFALVGAEGSSLVVMHIAASGARLAPPATIATDAAQLVSAASDGTRVLIDYRTTSGAIRSGIYDRASGSFTYGADIATNGSFRAGAGSSGFFTLTWSGPPALQHPGGGTLTADVHGVINAAAASETSNGTMIVAASASEFKSTLIRGGVTTQHTLPMAPYRSISAPMLLLKSSAGYVVVFSAVRISGGSVVAEVAALRLDNEGNAIEGAPARIAGSAASPAALADASIAGNTAFIVATERAPNGTRVTSTTFDGASGNVGTPNVVSLMPARQYDPAIASDGASFTTVFGESSADASLLRANSATVDETDADSRPAIAIGGGLSLLVWQEGQQIFAKRVSASGTVLDANPITVHSGTAAKQPDVAWNGSSFLAVWSETNGIFGATISTSGTVGAAQRITPDTSADADYHTHTMPRLAWNGSSYLLVWTDTLFTLCFNNGCRTIDRSRAMRVAADGAPREVIAEPLAVNAPRSSVASNGRDFLVLANGADLLGITVHGDGTLRADAPLAIFRWFANVYGDVAWNGSEYLVTWRYSDGQTPRLAFARVTSTVRDQAAVTVGAQDDRVTAPRIATNAAGQAQIATYETRQAGGPTRVTLYTPDELAPLPARPAAPKLTGVVALATNTYSIQWSGTPDASGYIVETRDNYGFYYIIATAPAGATSVTGEVFNRAAVRVRGWNAGGLSDPSNELSQTGTPPSRRRSAAH
jgi:hypothetical protein